MNGLKKLPHFLNLIEKNQLPLTVQPKQQKFTKTFIKGAHSDIKFSSKLTKTGILKVQ